MDDKVDQSTKIVQPVRNGKKHPLPPKQRSPSLMELKLSSVPVNFDCSTSDDDNTSIRRSSSRQTKKQKRAQKQNEVKEDRQILKEMRDPIPSTSGPLVREQERIKRMFPKRFHPSLPSGNIQSSNNPVKASQTSKKLSITKKAIILNNGTTGNAAGIMPNKDEIGKSKIIRKPIRRSSRHKVISHETGNTEGKEEKTNLEECNLVECNEIIESSTVRGIAHDSPAESYLPTMSVSSNHSTAKILTEKIQRLPKRFVPPGGIDSPPPTLSRIRPLEFLKDTINENEEPPELSPMFTGGTEITVSFTNSKGNTPKRVGRIQDTAEEPARKRLAATRPPRYKHGESSNTDQSSREAVHQGPRLRNRAPKVV